MRVLFYRAPEQGFAERTPEQNAYSFLDIHKITANKVNQWCLDKQEALYKEIVSVTGPQGKITQANLSSMKYLKVCSNFLAISK